MGRGSSRIHDWLTMCRLVLLFSCLVSWCPASGVRTIIEGSSLSSLRELLVRTLARRPATLKPSRILTVFFLAHTPHAGWLDSSAGYAGRLSVKSPASLFQHRVHKFRGGCGSDMSAVQHEESGYRVPSDDFVDLVDAPTQPSLSLDPTRRWLLFMENPPLPTLEDLCREERKLAGLRFDPIRRLPARARGNTQLILQPLFDSAGQAYSAQTAPRTLVEGYPEGSKVRSVSWRPHKAGFAFIVLPPRSGEPQLWFVEFDASRPEAMPERIQAERLLDAGGNPLKLNGIRDSALRGWHPDGERLLLDTVPWPEIKKDVPEADAAVTLPTGPSVQFSMPGVKAPARTYQDLLSSPEDEEEYEQYTTTQMLLYDLKTRRAEKLGPPDMYRSVLISPDGQFAIVSATRRPFSYLVPDGRFARDVEVWKLPEQGAATNSSGHMGKDSRWLVASLPVRDQIPPPPDAVEDMPRSFQWRPDAPHSLWFVEALDGGDPRGPASPDGYRDQLCQVEGPPFRLHDKAVVFQTEMRYAGFSAAKDGTYLLSEYRWKDRRVRQWVYPAGVGSGSLGQDRWLLFNRSFEDKYDDPGDFQTRMDPETGFRFLLQSNNTLFLSGTGASPKGNRPFVDVLRLPHAREAGASAATKRLWRCVAGLLKPGEPSEDPKQEVGGVLCDDRRDEYESPAVLLGGGETGNPLRMLFWREAQDKPPNLLMRTLEVSSPDDPLEDVPITDFQHPQPSLKAVRKQLVRYKRKDGVDLTAELYLPPGYDKDRDGPLPCLMWAYPQEYKSGDAAGQVSSTPHSFVRAYWSRPIFWLLRGYAVFDDPKMPVVGEGEEEPNDSFIEQLQMNAQAAVDCVVHQLGIADPDRICIGGHSYGAFMTAHLLAHTDLFRAGICRSGAYIRVLTPFGFQSEDRTYWEATDTYTTMSPFLYARLLAEKGAPLLLVHGQEDPNPGTYPMQSERFFQALKGHGATAKLVLLPKERHGYSARESILHVLCEQDDWLQEHNAPRAVNEDK